MWCCGTPLRYSSSCCCPILAGAKNVPVQDRDDRCLEQNVRHVFAHALPRPNPEAKHRVPIRCRRLVQEALRAEDLGIGAPDAWVRVESSHVDDRGRSGGDAIPADGFLYRGTLRGREY